MTESTREPGSTYETETAHLPRRIVAVLRNLDGWIAAHPLPAIGIAAGLGFAVGGGLSTRVGRMLMMSAARESIRRLL